MGLLNAEQQARAWKRFHMEQPYRPTEARRADKTSQTGLCHMIPGLCQIEKNIKEISMPAEEKREVFGNSLIVLRWAMRGVVITRTEAEQLLNTKR